ncbi:DUF4439 domain-containing protein [Cutibacterium sp. WCA-380-WT-3A]|uniref:DUF4439 domain-containing protein n=1 Tax=Cutibacterium porci TaxID=2605781 RepID=A0A7K0J944_9ACTN|nr:DUF4439 domain-containing protein [Cutibacterium porci]MSS46494.1 DUF4439 domain-containing protein [Cutibacterium porci]
MIARRTILASGATFVAIGLTGCTHDSPEKKSPARTTRPPATTPTAQRRDAVSTEALLADLATKASRGATGTQRTMLTKVAEAHRCHVEVLGQSNPFSGSTPSSAVSATPRRAEQGAPLSLLQRHEQAAATKYLSSCQTAQDSSEALLWASLSVFSSAVHPSSPIPQLTQKIVPVAVGKEPVANAQQALLTHLNALIAGLEWGIARLGDGDPLRAWGSNRRDKVLVERTEVRQSIRNASATPTPDLPGYPMSPAPVNAAATRLLWSGLEANVLSGWGRVTAASESAERRHGVAAMVGQTQVLAHLGTGVTAWPGWV